VLQPFRREQTPGRNKPCPCGSGKKAKKCHLWLIQAMAALPPRLREQVMVDRLLARPERPPVPKTISIIVDRNQGTT
jgi:hypothetical protein